MSKNEVDAISWAHIAAHNPQWLESLTHEERVVLFSDAKFWEYAGFYPQDDNWLTCGWIAGRGAGKTRHAGSAVQHQVEHCGARKIAIVAQDEVRGYQICTEALINDAPPWCRPEIFRDALHWPNGAVAYIYTPESPEALRGPTFDLAWATEISFWRPGVALLAWHNMTSATRPVQRIIWDSTSKGASPLIQVVMAENEIDPVRYRIIRGSMLDNPLYGKEYIQKEARKYGGPGARRFEEEVNGAVYDSEEGAAFTLHDIETSRVYEHPSLDLKIVGIDPAITTSEDSDASGIVFGGRDRDGNGYALRDLSGRHSPEKTCELAVDLHNTDRCAGAIVEMNRGGEYLINALKATARSKGIDLHVLESGDKFPRYMPGRFYVRKVTARASKLDRAIPVATAMKLGQVHMVGSFPELEKELYTYDGTGLSPNRFDAFNDVMNELLGLTADVTLASNRQKRAEQANRATRKLAGAISVHRTSRSLV